MALLASPDVGIHRGALLKAGIGGQKSEARGRELKFPSDLNRLPIDWLNLPQYCPGLIRPSLVGLLGQRLFRESKR
jgi:hypothetical protein